MKKFTERDLDRPWSTQEVAALSEGELTKLVFFRDYKNFVFFVPAGYVLYLVGDSFGLFGKIVGWLGVVMFGVFALQGLLNTALGVPALVGTPVTEKVAPVKTAFWRLILLFISFGNFAIYAALAVLVYSGMYGLKLAQFISW